MNNVTLKLASFPDAICLQEQEKTEGNYLVPALYSHPAWKRVIECGPFCEETDRVLFIDGEALGFQNIEGIKCIRDTELQLLAL